MMPPPRYGAFLGACLVFLIIVICILYSGQIKMFACLLAFKNQPASVCFKGQ